MSRLTRDGTAEPVDPPLAICDDHIIYIKGVTKIPVYTTIFIIFIFMSSSWEPLCIISVNSTGTWGSCYI